MIDTSKPGNMIDASMIGIFLGNYSRGFHVREIARHYDMNHGTASRRLRALEARGVLTHIIKGRNRTYYLNLSNWLTHTHIGMAETEKLICFINEGGWQEKLIKIISRPKNVRLDGGPSVILAGTSKDSEIIVLDGNQATRDSLKEAGIEKATYLTKKEFRNMLRNGMLESKLKDHVVLRNRHKFVNVMWNYWIKESKIPWGM